MATFTINFVNNSNVARSFCVFQKNAHSPNPNVLPLAWRAQFAHAHSRLSISWNADLYFFWAKTGGLRPGLIFNAGEVFPADLNQKMIVTLTKQDGNYRFVNPQPGYNFGTLTINADAYTAINQASVGIGLSGAPGCAVQAQPNMMFLFEPRIEYWVTFGDFQQGQVLDPSQLNDVPKIDFPHGIFSMEVTLNADHSWTIEPGLD